MFYLPQTPRVSVFMCQGLACKPRGGEPDFLIFRLVPPFSGAEEPLFPLLEFEGIGVDTVPLSRCWGTVIEHMA